MLAHFQHAIMHESEWLCTELCYQGNERKRLKLSLQSNLRMLVSQFCFAYDLSASRFVGSACRSESDPLNQLCDTGFQKITSRPANFVYILASGSFEINKK